MPRVWVNIPVNFKKIESVDFEEKRPNGVELFVVSLQPLHFVKPNFQGVL